MKITFLGAAHEVTGSCTLIEVGDKKGIVDCGMEQGKDLFVNRELPVSAAELDFALLTHAHIDHSGMLPKLYKEGFRGLLYTSAATASLCDIMLRDSANIQMSEAEYQTKKALRKGGQPVEPVYDLDDVAGLLKQIRPLNYGEAVQINDCVTVRLTDVGHLLGSAAIEIWLTENGETRKICFSGDVGNIDQPILQNPKSVKSADYVVIESTYGDRNHVDERPDYVSSLAGVIQKVLDRGGNVIIPSFAVGRTQEMLYFIREIKEKGMVRGHGDFPVYVDSPLAIEATTVFLQCDTQFVDQEMQAVIRSGVNPIVFPGLELAVSQQESKAINEDKRPKVIISASGMCDAGRVRHHLKHNLWRAESMVLFVGYQSAGTLGRLLVDGAKKVKLFGDEIAVRAEIAQLPGVSGHADKRGLINWLQGFEQKPKLVFVNHGDPDSADNFTACLNDELGYTAFAPYSGSSYDLLRGEHVELTKGVAIVKKPKGPTISASYTQLMDTAEQLVRTVEILKGRSNKELNRYREQLQEIISKMQK